MSCHDAEEAGRGGYGQRDKDGIGDNRWQVQRPGKSASSWAYFFFVKKKINKNNKKKYNYKKNQNNEQFSRVLFVLTS